MTIAELAGPVLMRVFPTAFAVVLVTLLIALLPVAPRVLAWLRGPAPHTGHQPANALGQHGHTATHGHQTGHAHGPHDHHAAHHAPHHTAHRDHDHDHEVVHRL